MSFFTQQKSSFFKTNGPPKPDKMFNTQDFTQSLTQTDAQLFGTQESSSQKVEEDDWESQISAIFANPRNSSPVTQSAHLFSQSQNVFNRNALAELANVDQNDQSSFNSQENCSSASPIRKRRAYETSPGSNIPKSRNLPQTSASSFFHKSAANNYQSPRDEPHCSTRALTTSVSSEFHTPIRTKFSQPAALEYHDSQEKIFKTQDDDPRTQNRELSQTFDPTAASASLSQAYSSQGGSFGFQSQHQSSQASTISEPIDDDFDIENFVPSSIRKLHKAVKEKHSDAVFTWLICSQLCQDIFPMGAYSNLKLSLLLSLASMSTSSQPLHVAAIGLETSHANMIMRSIGRFAKRFVMSTIPNFEGSSDGHDNQVSAGPLLLAQKGVFFVGEWLRLPANCAMRLLRTVETGQVMMEKVQQRAPLECALWAYWSSSNKLKKDASTVNQFISVFGFPTMIDDAVNDGDIIDHLLNSNQGNQEKNDTFHIDDDDMSLYLNYAAKQIVTMDPEAVEMLEDYYSAVRILRPEALTPKAFEVLKQMAESHAKLSLRNQVMGVDALAAISICEHYVRSFFVKDAFSSPPEIQINNVDDIDAYQARLNSWFETLKRNILHR